MASEWDLIPADPVASPSKVEAIGLQEDAINFEVENSIIQVGRWCVSFSNFFLRFYQRFPVLRIDKES